MSTKQAKIKQVVTKVINKWDPYHLIRGGAPRDEFKREIADICKLVPHAVNASEFAYAISDVFSKAFEPRGFAPGDCMYIGKKLCAELKKAKMVKEQENERKR